MKNKKYFLIFLMLIAVGFVIAIRFSNTEDTWICENGSWVKHGNPAEEKPNTPCKINGVEKNGGVVGSDKFEINLPYGWYKLDKPITGVDMMITNGEEKPNEEATKKINFRTYYAITHVSWDKTIDEYVLVYEKQIKDAIKNIEIVNTQKGEVNGYEARFLDLKLNQMDINFKVFVSIIKGKNGDVWIFSFNTTDQYWNKYEGFVSDLLKTFKLKD